MQDIKESPSCSCPVAFLVFFPRSTRARIVAPHFRPRANGVRRFRLRGARLILQSFLLTLLSPLDFPRDGRQVLRLVSTRCSSACSDRISARTGWLGRRRRLRGTLRRRLLALLHLNVEEIADRFVIDARHHVFEQRESLFLELDDGIFLRVAAQPDALFQVIQREQMVFPLRIHHVENNAALEPAHQVRTELFFFFLLPLFAPFAPAVPNPPVPPLPSICTLPL